VIAQAGLGCIADIAAAQKPAIIIAQSRPFDEQVATAQTLARAGLAVVIDDWPDLDAWPALITAARAIEPNRWTRWQTAGSAARAAQAVADVADHCAPNGDA
jgi:predicted glycosyltransferase